MKAIPIQHKTDGYKLDHISQKVPGTTRSFSNMTPRSDKLLAAAIRASNGGKMVFFGLQYALQRLVNEWNEDFFLRNKMEVMAAYKRRVKNYVGPDHGDRGIEAMGKLHDLGYLPLRVRALPEGSRVPMRVPVYVIENTMDDFEWLVNYAETYLSDNTWPMFNAASLSEQYYRTSKKWAEISGAPDFWVGIANHCFAARGHRGDEDAMISGMAHMLFSIGTDTLWAIDGIEHYYHGNSDTELLGVSVNAFEHATATQRIAHFGSEKEALRDALVNVYPTGIMSYVGDSIDLFKLVAETLPELKDEILARQPDSAGLCKLVIRPDSSRKSPKEIILGYKVYEGGDYPNLDHASRAKGFEALISLRGSQHYKQFVKNKCDAIRLNGVVYDARAYDCEDESSFFYVNIDNPIDELEVPGVLHHLWEGFGGTKNDKGLRVLHEKIGLIYGEGITIEMQEEIYAGMVERGWCVSNVLLGIGSWAFLKDSSRDTFGVAIKGTASIANGKLIEQHKAPKTDTGTKHSAKGLVRVDLIDGEFVLRDQQTLEEYEGGELQVVWENGVFLRRHAYQEIRARLGVKF